MSWSRLRFAAVLWPELIVVAATALAVALAAALSSISFCWAAFSSKMRMSRRGPEPPGPAAEPGNANGWLAAARKLGNSTCRWYKSISCLNCNRFIFRAGPTTAGVAVASGRDGRMLRSSGWSTSKSFDSWRLLYLELTTSGVSPWAAEFAFSG